MVDTDAIIQLKLRFALSQEAPIESAGDLEYLSAAIFGGMLSCFDLVPRSRSLIQLSVGLASRCLRTVSEEGRNMPFPPQHHTVVSHGQWFCSYVLFCT